MVFKEISLDDGRRLKDFLREAGYDEDSLRQQGHLKEPPSGRLRNLPRLLDRTREPNRLNTLLRLFWLGVPQPAARVALLPEWFTALARSVGLLHRAGDCLASEAMLYPGEGVLSVCDHSAKLGPLETDFVLWPNQTSRMLSRFTLRRPSRATLDLGTGNAIQSLSAARHSEQVVATDLNPRAINYAKFAVALNGLDNVECLTGDGFAPVAGCKFDLIVCNPPFFISPSNRHSFCDNSMDLDQLCRRFVKEAPEYLEEGGYFQVLCEWAQIRGQSWKERVTEWVEGSGCDAWILKVHTEDPADYTQSQFSLATASPDHDSELYNEYIAYYRERSVEAIHDGIIAIRRRSGRNWCVLEEFAEIPKEPFGESILRTFAAQDFLQTHATDEQILAEKLRLSPTCRLDQFFEPGNGAWQPTSLTLRLTKGFPFFASLQPPVAELLSACDGSRTAGELIQGFAQQVDAPLETVQSECLGIIRGLVERGFIVC
ncbi:MAG: methyltransferase [Candidatus Sulfotelmatobacter sp.]